MLLLIYPRKSYRHPAPRELAKASVVYYNWQYLIAKLRNNLRIKKEKGRKVWKISNFCLSLQRERRSQVEPRCAERWHLRDDEQFDLAAWFPSLKYRAGHELTSFYCILM